MIDTEKPTQEKEIKTQKADINKKKEVEAIVNIYTSFNNTIVHVTDMSGKTISKVTGGMVTKHGRLKANPTIAMFIAKRIAENVKDLGVKSLYVRVRAKTGNPAHPRSGCALRPFGHHEPGGRSATDGSDQVTVRSDRRHYPCSRCYPRFVCLEEADRRDHIGIGTQGLRHDSPGPGHPKRIHRFFCTIFFDNRYVGKPGAIGLRLCQ